MGSEPVKAIKMFGKVKNVRQDKGFAFIAVASAAGVAPDDPELGDLMEDHFMHKGALVGSDFASLCVGHQVEFEHTDHPKGPRAVRVRVVFN